VERRIYLDNAATSWPKPPSVCRAMQGYLQEIGGSPGRSGHRMAIEAAGLLAEARENLATLFNVDDPSRVVFTKNVTEALNLALRSLVRPGDHVVTTGVEHNSVMRPLRALEARGARLSVVPCGKDGIPDLAALGRALELPTRLLVTTHASNVIGTVVPLGELVALAHARRVPVLVDAAQTAGAHPIDVSALGIDLLAFTGHKSLYGPPGTGGLCLGGGIELEPLVLGGTGSESELELQPEFLPDALEGGTPNTVGIAGLDAGVRFVLERGVEAIADHERLLASYLLSGLAEIPGLRVYGPAKAAARIGLVSLNIEGVSPSDIGLILDRRFGVMCRIGLHCAPAAHRTLGTYPFGTVRLAWSAFTTEDELDAALEGLAAIAEQRAGLTLGASRR
jgi:cysteine desulfurase/selenocysteine lyase